MRTLRRKSKKARKQLNIRLDAALYQTLEAVARQDKNSVPEAAKELLERGLQERLKIGSVDDVVASDIARLAGVGGAFEWLGAEPELYDDMSGQPV
jgi:hypothetical protein